MGEFACGRIDRKHFGSPSRVNSVKARQSEHARALLSLGKKKKSSSSGSVKNWSWSPTMVESIIDSLKEYKSLCEFNATDFNADKVKLYGKVRQMMAGKCASENYFGPVF